MIDGTMPGPRLRQDHIRDENHLVAILVVALGLLLALPSCDRPKSADQPRARPACLNGQTRCHRGSEIQTCRDEKWSATAVCPFHQGCDVLPGREPECRDLPRRSPIPGGFLRAGMSVDEAVERLSRPGAPTLCRIFNALMDRPGREGRESGGGAAIPHNMRIGVDDAGRRALFRCAFGRLLGELFEIVRDAALLAERGQYRVAVIESAEGLDYRLRLIRPGPGPAAAAGPPGAVLEAQLTSRNRIGIDIGAKAGAAAAPELEAFAFLSYRSGDSGDSRRYRKIRDLVERMERGLAAFFWERRFTTFERACIDPAALESIFNNFPLMKRHRDLIRCGPACRAALEPGDWLRAYARRPPPMIGARPELESGLLERLPAAVPALVCLGFLEQLSRSGRAEPPLAPNQRLGMERLAALWRAAMTPDGYVRTLIVLAPLAGEGWRGLLTAFLGADPAAFRRGFLPLLDRMDKTARLILPYWARRDRHHAVPILIERYPRYANDRRLRRLVLDAIGENGSPAAVPFLFARLDDGSATPRAIGYLLLNRQSRPETERRLVELLPGFDDERALGVLDFMFQHRPKKPEERPMRLLPAVRELAGRTQSFKVYYKSHEVLLCYESETCEWVSRPPGVDRWAQGEFDPADAPACIERAAAGYQTMKAEDVIELYHYSLSLRPERRGRIGRLLVELGRRHPAVGEVTRRLSELKRPPEVVKLAKGVIKEF